MLGTGDPIKSQNQPSQISAHAHLSTHVLYRQKLADSFIGLSILPVSNSAAIMAVWAFMMAKWGLILILYGNKYIHIVATSHRPLINQAVTSHHPIIEA
uniref:Uncharacterized protein n=1 Tax=Timema tahoe TaxID=61484 RepID=A0A7R9FJM0_9NEOP|nr:unnamed protein product [Timema tahoe]